MGKCQRIHLAFMAFRQWQITMAIAVDLQGRMVHKAERVSWHIRMDFQAVRGRIAVKFSRKISYGNVCEELLFDRTTAHYPESYVPRLLEAIERHLGRKTILCTTRIFARHGDRRLARMKVLSDIHRLRGKFVFICGQSTPLEEFIREVLELDQEAALLCSVEGESQLSTFLEIIEKTNWPLKWTRTKKPPFLPALAVYDSDRVYLVSSGT